MSEQPFKHEPEMNELQKRDMRILRDSTPIANYGPNARDKNLPVFVPAGLHPSESQGK